MSEIGNSAFACRTSNSCSILSDADFEKLVEAARLYETSRSTLMSMISAASITIEKGMSAIPDEWRVAIVDKVRESLDYAVSVALTGVDNEPGKASSEAFYKLLTVTTGATGGVFGLPGVLVEIPFSTLTILRSIADIGRSLGEDIDDPEFRATCVEVFAYGGPDDNDDESELAFLAARIAAVELTEYLAQIATRYASVMLPKIALMSTPGVGAILGGGVNLGFMNFYQSMARVLFMIKPIEKKNDRSQVRSCFAALVKEIQSKKAAKAGKRVATT